jgi:lipoprotein signal peptidase
MSSTTNEVKTFSTKRTDHAYRSPVAWATLLGVLIIGLALDLGTKYWSFDRVAGQPVLLDRDKLLADRTYNPIPQHDGVRVLPGRLLDFRLVINRGAVFGPHRGQRGRAHGGRLQLR